MIDKQIERLEYAKTRIDKLKHPDKKYLAFEDENNITLNANSKTGEVHLERRVIPTLFRYDIIKDLVDSINKEEARNFKVFYIGDYIDMRINKFKALLSVNIKDLKVK